MELEEMKQLWQQYDKQLQQTKAMNNRMIHTMLKDRTQNNLQKLLNYEYMSLVACGIVLILLTISAGQVGGGALMTSCLAISFALCLVSIAAGFYKIKLLSRTSFTKPVTQTLETLNRFNLFLTKERVATIILFPPLIFALTALGRKLIWHEDMLENMSFWAPVLLVAIGIGIIACLIVYRNLYFKKITTIRENLQEIADFTKE